MKKPSFLERLTGNTNQQRHRDYDQDFDDEDDQSFLDDNELNDDVGGFQPEEPSWQDSPSEPAPTQEGELPVDMYQTDDEIVIRTLVAGVSPEELEISITRDMVTIKGLREELQETNDDNYFRRELFWGGFSRTLVLPEEVIIDEAEAQEKHGLLEIRLPKLDKHRSTQLKVKSNYNK